MPRRRVVELERERQAAEAVELEEPRRLEVAVSTARGKPVDEPECEHEWEDVSSARGATLRQCRLCPATSLGSSSSSSAYAFGSRGGGF